MVRPSLAIAVALVVSTAIASISWVVVRTSRRTTIDVRGSAKRRITADLATWDAVVTVVKPTRAEAYAALKTNVAGVTVYLTKNGIAAEQQRILAASVTELEHDEAIEDGQRVRHKTVKDGFQAVQTVQVTSNNVPLIERLSRESTQLIENGIDITSDSPEYLYTKVADLKIEMLAEASRDARARAEAMLSAAGGGAKVGRVDNVDTGVININAANSTETSWEGNYDVSAIDKDMLTTVRVSFEVLN